MRLVAPLFCLFTAVVSASDWDDEYNDRDTGISGAAVYPGYSSGTSTFYVSRKAQYGSNLPYIHHSF